MSADQFMQKACKHNVCRLFIGGAAGIRTPVPLRTNGFQVIWGEVKGPNLLRFKAIYYPKYTLLMHLSQYV